MQTTVDERHHQDRKLPEKSSKHRWYPKIRVGVFYVALLLAAAMTIVFLPDLLVLLVTGWTDAAGAALDIHRLHIMSIAAVVGVFLLGLFAQAYHPRRRVAAMWGAFAIILSVSAGTIVYGVGRPEEVLPFLLVTSIALLAHPAGRRLLEYGTVSPLQLGLVAIAAIPLLSFIITQLMLTPDLADPHAVQGHYVMMVGLAIAPLAYGIFAALRFRGWRLASWLAALPMVYYGMLSIAFPLQSGSTGAIWGGAAIIWAVSFVVVAEYAHRTNKSSSSHRK